jgi:type IV pilus assembly protein PilP
MMAMFWVQDSRRSKALALSWPCLALVAMLSACSGSSSEEQETRAFMQHVEKETQRQVQRDKQKKIFPPLPELGSAPVPLPKETGRSPFSPVRAAPRGKPPDVNRPREPLEAFPLTTLRMKGVVQGLGDRFALVAAPDGVVYKVRVGNYMGTHYGRVMAIRERDIEIRETVPSPDGGWVERTVYLNMAAG